MNKLIVIQNTEHLTALMKAIVPRSFEKAFNGLTTVEIVAGVAYCTDGLTQTELNTGLAKMKQTGFCPDPAVFAKWCKGIDGFDNKDAIADSYIAKNGALSQIIKWLDDDRTPITEPMKQAYNETLHLWRSIHTASDKARAENAFKDVYEFIVNQLVEQRIACKMYIAPVALPTPSEQNHTPASKEFALSQLAKFKKAA